jgi:UPF0755 protein
MGPPFKGWEGESIVVVLEPGLAAGDMFERLTDEGVLGHPGLLRASGEYRFDRPHSPLEVLARLSAGDVLLHAVTIPEGLTLVQVAERLEEFGFGERDDLARAFGDPTPIQEWDPEATDLEGYLFPETYHFPRGIGADEVARNMVRRFRSETGEEYASLASDWGLTIREAVVLASMIEKETSVPGERPLIARVFHNRLDRGMRMQCDPTVRYAIERTGKSLGRLTYADLEFDSAWNTYVVSGLPPGPIASPGLASLQAAVAPEESKALYFVAAPEGGHRFSNDLRQHQQAVAEWRRYSRSLR